MKRLVPFIILFLLIFSISAQTINNNEEVSAVRCFRSMFYNCENLFDTFNDSLKNDEEYLPEGKRYWTNKKFNDKLYKISKVIIAVGEGQPVDVVGLAEVENRFVLEQLLDKTLLSKLEYKIVHKESPDRRGIDVALIYREESFKLLSSSFLTNNEGVITRDILLATGLVNGKDTLHVFVNHWPSRWGGQQKSEHKRVIVANLLKNKVDSIISNNEGAHILIMGDFNDEPHNNSVAEVLGVKNELGNIEDIGLYNLMVGYDYKIAGTHKYKGRWSMLDQIIVSGNLINSKSLYTDPNMAKIYSSAFLQVDDEKNLGKKPYRTYTGYSYSGGFSDHFPVYVDFKCSD